MCTIDAYVCTGMTTVLDTANLCVCKMERKKISPEKTVRVKKKRLFIILEQKFDVIEQHKYAQSNATIGGDVGMCE